MDREEKLRRRREQDRARRSNFHVMQQLLPSGLPHDASNICLVMCMFGVLCIQYKYQMLHFMHIV